MAGGKTRLADDFRDLLRAFVAHDVRFLVVGAYALAVLGRPRATGDLDVWIDPTPANAKRTFAALRCTSSGTRISRSAASCSSSGCPRCASTS